MVPHTPHTRADTRTLQGAWNITALNVSYNRLKSLPDGLTGLGSLTVLDAAHNELACIPDAVRALTHLAVLDLAFNELSFVVSCFAGALATDAIHVLDAD